jgi:hypothetical protein
LALIWLRLRSRWEIRGIFILRPITELISLQ